MPAVLSEDETRTHDRALGSIKGRDDLLQQVGEDVESSVPEGLARIIRRGLAKDPDERYESAQALGDALGSLQP